MGSASANPLTTPRKGPKPGSGGVQISEGIDLPEVDAVVPPKSKVEKKKKKKKSIDREKLKALQGNVQANINALSLTSLFATIIGDPIEAREIRKRIKFVWKFLTRGFQLIPFANNWFELRFDVVEDRERVWEARPFHISGQLMVLRPWRLDFDPWTESITRMDLWVRFPGLPVKYIDDKLLKDIVEDNELGEVLRVAAFNEKGEEEFYPVWFEDFPEGCGCCGSRDHAFESCPM